MTTCICKTDHGISSTGYCPNCGGAKPTTAEQENAFASLFPVERFGSEAGRERSTEGLIKEAVETIAALRAEVATLTKELLVAKRNEAVCHCGSPMSAHGMGDGHSPVEMQEECPYAAENATLRTALEARAIEPVSLNHSDCVPLRTAYIEVINGLSGRLAGKSFGSGNTSWEHLIWMLGECLLQIRTMPIDKMSRWVGFVQGVMVMNGVLDVDEERACTRPIFHKAYAALAGGNK